MKHALRMIRLLLVLALMLGLMVLPAHAAAPTRLYVGDTNVVSGGFWLNNSGSLTTDGASAENYNVRYDPTANKLYLNGAEITTNHESRYGIYANGDLTIVVEADSVVDISATDSGNGYNYALYCAGNLTVSGSGKLTLTGGKGSIAYGISIGTWYDLTVDSGVEVTATAGTATEGNSTGVELYGDIICRGTLTGNGGSASGSAYSQSVGIYSDKQIKMEGGTLTGKGGLSDATSALYGSYGVKADAISGTGTVTAIGGDAPKDGFSCGYHTGNNTASVDVSNLRLIAQGGDYGLYLSTDYNPTGSLWLTAEGGTSAVKNSSHYTLRIKSGTEEATLYERQSEDDGFTLLSGNSRNVANYAEDCKYYELVVDHEHKMSDYSSDAVNHWRTCIAGDYSTCPLGYEENVPHTLDGNNTCVCGLEAVASVTSADGSTVSYYSTFDEALTAAEASANSTVKLLKDITEPKDEYYGFQVQSGEFTLDLNGKKIDVPSSYGLYAKNYAKLSITDSSEAKTGAISAKVYAVSAASTGAAVTIDGGTYNKVSVSAECSLEIRDGVFQAAEAVSVIYHNANLTITGGTFTGPQPAIRFGLDVGVYSGKTEISGGTFVGGLKITKSGMYQGSAPIAANILASGYNYFEGDTATALYATEDDPYTVAGTTVTVAKRPIVVLSTEKDIYQYGEDIVYTWGVAQTDVTGKLELFFTGRENFFASWTTDGSTVPVLGSNYTDTRSFENMSIGDFGAWVVYTPDNSSTYEAAASAVLTVKFTKATITKDNWATYLDVVGLGEYVYDGTERPVTHSTKTEKKPIYTITYTDGDGNPVDVPRNAGTYNVVLNVSESDYFEAVTDLVIGTVEIKRATPTIDHLDWQVPAWKDYDGEPYVATASAKPGLVGFGTVTVIYEDNKDDSRSETAPVYPGNFDVYAVIGEGGNYTAAELLLAPNRQISPATPGISLTLSGTQTIYEDEITFAVEVSGPDAGVTPEGTVKITSGAEEIASGTLTDGKFTFTTGTLPAGDYSVKATYVPAEDAPYNEAASAETVLKVEPKEVELTVSGTDHTYDGTQKTITFTNNTQKLDESGFTVTYYLVDENNGTVTKVNKAVSVGKYLYVVEPKDAQNYCFQSAYAAGNSSLPDETTQYDNAGYLTVNVKLPEVLQPIYFTEGSATAYITDETYQNTLTNSNTGAAVTYKSSNASIATVDENGKVTLLKEGTVTIIATCTKDGTTPVTASYTLTVAKKAVTVKLAEGTGVIYGGYLPTAADLTNSEGLSYADLSVSGTLSFTGYTVGQGVGTYYVTPAGITSSKYDLTFEAAALTVTPKEIDYSGITVSAAAKQYDATTDAVLTAAVADGAVISGDKVTVSAEGAYASANAGTTLVNITAVTLEGKDAGNYVLTGTAPTTAQGSITQATVTFTASSKSVTFDGEAHELDITAKTSNGLSADYDVTYSGDCTAVGQYTAAVELKDTVNYTADVTSLAEAKLTVKAAAQQSFTITGLEQTVRYGDTVQLGTENAEGTVTFTVEGEAATLEDGKLTATGVGSVTVTATSVKEGHTDKTVKRAITIQPRVLTADVSAESRTYNGETAVNAVASLNGVLPGDEVSAAATAKMANADAGTGKDVTASVSLSGEDAGLYTLSTSTLTTTVDIAPKSVEAIVFTAGDKYYDGTDSAEIAGVSVYGALDSDQVSAEADLCFDGTDAGEQTVSVFNVVLTGADAGNYAIDVNTVVEADTANILQVEVSILCAETTTRTFDGKAKRVDVSAMANGAVFTGYSVSYAKDGVSEEPVNVGTYDVVITLNDTTNYTLAPYTAQLIIEPAVQGSLSIEGIPERVYYGDSFEISVPGEVSYEIMGPAELDGNTVTATDVGSVTITATVTAENFDDQVITRTFTVQPRVLTPTAEAQNRTYNAETWVDVAITLDNVVIGDSVSATASAEMATADAGDKLVYVTDIALDEATMETGRYVLSDTGLQTRVHIEPVTIDSISGVEADSKTYDGTAEAVVRIFDSEDILDADKADVTIHGSGSFADANAEEGKTVTVKAEGLSGSKANNYVLAENVTAEAIADILPAEVFFQIHETVFVYDGEPKSVTIIAECNGENFTDFTVEYDSEERIEAGEYTVTVTLNDERNYTGAPEPFVMVIEPDWQDELIISGMPGIIDYGKRFKLTASAEEGAVVTWSSSDETVATVDENGNVTILDVDREVTITATATKEGHFDMVNYVAFTPVAKQVSFRLSSLNTTYNGKAQSVTVTPSVEGMTDYTVTYTDESGNAVTPVDAGVYYVEVSSVGDKYEGYAAGTLTVNKAQLTGTVTMEGWTYGESAKAPGYTLSVEGITPTYTYSGTGMKDGVPCNAGAYTVTAVFTADNYETLTVSADFEVKKATLTVTAADATRVYGAGDPAFAVTYAGFVNGDDESALLVLPMARTEAGADADVGTYPITASGGRAENYDFVYVDGKLTVTAAKAVLTITGCAHDLSVGDTAQLHAYAGGEEVQVKWTSSDESVATVDEKGNVTIHKAGDVTITAQMAEGNYAAATATFTIHAGKKTVSLTPKTTVFTFNGQVQAVEFMAVDGFTPVVGQNVKVRYTLSTDASVTTFRDTGTYTVVYEIDDPAYQGSGVVTLYMNPAQSEGSETLCPSRHFTDIEKDVWYHEGVDYVVANGMMNGVSATRFAPDMNTSRGMIVTILYRMEGSPEAGENPFDDVKPGSYYEKAIAWAAANGIVNGYSEASFGPDDSITREQMAAILYRYASYKGCDVSAAADLSAYTDAGKISQYAVEAMSWANAEGLINGKSAAILDPTGGAKRCEVATILMRFCKSLAE